MRLSKASSITRLTDGSFVTLWSINMRQRRQTQCLRASALRLQQLASVAFLDAVSSLTRLTRVRGHSRASGRISVSVDEGWIFPLEMTELIFQSWSWNAYYQEFAQLGQLSSLYEALQGWPQYFGIAYRSGEAQ